VHGSRRSRSAKATLSNDQERVFFNGWYDVDEDDFAGDAYYANPATADGSYVRFSTPDKRKCGSLYLRALRTGARALHGSSRLSQSTPNDDVHSGCA